MRITITVDEVTMKEADDLAEEVIVFLRDEAGILVSDYTVERD